MPDSYEDLFEAIITVDRARVRSLLRKHARLARVTTPIAWLDRRIGHWIYAGDSALHVAAAGHRSEIARYLLEAGADANFAGNHRDSRPLHYAADGYIVSANWNPRQQVATINLLLAAGAEIDAPDKNGATALHRAVRTRCAAAVRGLLDAGAKANARNKPGSTPFHLAVQNTGRGGSGSEIAKLAQYDIIQAFLAHGVSPQIKDANGKSVVDWARNQTIMEMLAGNRV
jgi:ankyrin repeat protein